MIDHTGHPHPSTPKARALCRANGGTGFIGKIGGEAPVAKKGDNDKPAARKRPHVVDVTPDKPKAPVAPPKSPTVPKDHGTPKPPTAPKKPVAPKPPAAKPRETPVPPRVPPRDLSGQMKGYIPESKVPSTGGQIQNALRNGASRDFIVSKSPLLREETDALIDRILAQYGVPNHVYPRVGTGGKAPDIKAVKPTPLAKVAEKVAGNKELKTPTIDTPELKAAKAAVDVHSEMKATVDRVLTLQASHVGSKVSRIKSVDSKLPEVGTPAAERMGVTADTLAVCTHDGHIHLHSNLHTKGSAIDRHMLTGWFTRGGSGTEQSIAHEMGHALLTNFSMSANDRKELATAMIETFDLVNPRGNSPNLPYYINHLEGIIDKPENKAKIKRQVSKYAGTNPNEFIAEVWSEYTMNPNPRPKIKKIGDVIKGIIERGR